MAQFTVGYLVGSLATKSLNRLLAKAAGESCAQNYMAEFHGFIARVYTVLPRPVGQDVASTAGRVRAYKGGRS